MTLNLLATELLSDSAGRAAMKRTRSQVNQNRQEDLIWRRRTYSIREGGLATGASRVFSSTPVTRQPANLRDALRSLSDLRRDRGRSYWGTGERRTCVRCSPSRGS